MTIPFQLLLIFPFLVVAALWGWRRGWKEEAITLVVLLLSLVFFGSLSRTSLLAILVNRIVEAFASFFGTLIGTDIQTRSLVSTENPTLFQIIGFFLTVMLAYAIGTGLGQRRDLSAVGRLAGSILSIFNVFLIASQAFRFINQRNPDLLNREGTIIVTQDTNVNALLSYLPSLFAILFVVLLIVLVLRLPKIRE